MKNARGKETMGTYNKSQLAPTCMYAYDTLKPQKTEIKVQITHTPYTGVQCHLIYDTSLTISHCSCYYLV